MEKIKELISKLPFRGFAEKIPEGTIGKLPFLAMLIPLANYIASGLIVLILVAFIAGASSGGDEIKNDPTVIAMRGKASTPSDFRYVLNDAGNGVIITGMTGTASRVTVPARIEGYPVVEIGNGAFNGKNVWINLQNWEVTTTENQKAGITSITIPNTVTKIGREAFANTAITGFNIPNSVTEIGNSAFENTNLTKIIIPDSVKFLRGSSLGGTSTLFADCKLLTEIRLSDNIELLTYLGSLPALKKINLPKNLKYMGTIFGSMPELVDLIIPDSLTEITFVRNSSTWSRYDGDRDGFISIYSEGPSGIFGHVPADEGYTHDGFKSSQKLPLRTRQRLRDLGFTIN